MTSRGMLAVLATLVSVPVSASAYEARFNCGGPTYVASDGKTYLADQPWSAGGAGYVGGFADDTWQPIGGTPDPALYQTVRASGGYRFDVPNGRYRVTLHVTDFWGNGPRVNQFDVSIEGAPVLSNVDLFARVGKNYASVYRFDAQVSDGRLDVTVHVDRGFAFLQGIAVESAAFDGTPPAIPIGVTAFASHARISVAWTPNTDPDLASYVVYRREEPGGLWQALSPPVVVSWWHDATVLANKTYSYQVRAADVFGNQSAASTSSSAAMLTASTLPYYEIFMTPADLDQLNTVAGVEGSDYFPGTFVYGSQVFQSIGVRYRGNITRTLPKKSWKIRFDDGEPFGLADRLNLNAEFPDMSLERQVLSYETFRLAGIPAPRTEFVNVALNGEFLGVHDSVQEMDELFLSQNGLDPNGDLYEAQSNFGTLPDTAAYESAYDKKTNEDEGYGALIELIEAINAATNETFWSVAAPRLDMETTIEWWSINSVLSNLDFSQKNYYLHRDPTTNVWRVLPWDVDFTFGKNDILAQGYAPDLAIIVGNGNVLVNRMLATPVIRRKLMERIVSLSREVFTPGHLDPRIDELHALIAPDVAIDWKKFGWESSAAFDASPTGLKSYVTGRGAYIEQNAASYLLDDGLVINEVMARNTSGASDEAGEHEGWIEIYNGSPVAKGLGGKFLSNDPLNTRKWQLPSVALQPGGYALFWADGETTEGPMHTSFTLDGGGGWIGLFASDVLQNVPIDFQYFGPQLEDVSLGRSGEGQLYWTRFGNPSPGGPANGAPNSPPVIAETERDPAFPTSVDPVRVTARVTDADGLGGVVLHADDGATSETTMLDDGAHGDGPAGDDVFGAELPARPDGTIVRYYVRAVDGAGVAATDPVGAPASTYAYEVGYSPPTLAVNEVLASNASINRDEAGQFDDWVEIHNFGGSSIDLGDMSLTDNVSQPRKWVFPDTLLAPGAYVLVWCDNDLGQGPLHASFKLDAAGEAVHLFERPSFGGGPIDGYAFGAQSVDISYGRFPDDTGSLFFFGTPTPAAPNQLGNTPPTVREVAIAPNPPPPLLPVFVTAEIVDNGSVALARLYYDATDDGQANYLALTMFDDGTHGDGPAGDRVYGAGIPGQPDGRPVAFYVFAQDDEGATATSPAGGPTDPYHYVSGYDPPLLVINEIMALNTATVHDEFGEYDDWIEIFNAGPTAVNVGGMKLSDDLGSPGDWSLPSAVVPSGGFLLVWADNDPGQGPFHTSFGLGASGEEIALFDTEFHFNAFIDGFEFATQHPDTSYGRIPDGSESFAFMPTPTPGTANELVDVPPGTASLVMALVPSNPNPFQRHTAIGYALGHEGIFQLRVFDVQGRHVRTLATGAGRPGRYTVDWDGRNESRAEVGPGVYFLRLEQLSRSLTRKLVRVP